MNREQKLEAALREIADQTTTYNIALDPDWPCRIALKALATPADANAQTGFMFKGDAVGIEWNSHPSPSISDEAVERAVDAWLSERGSARDVARPEALAALTETMRIALTAASLPAVERAPVVTEEMRQAAVARAITALPNEVIGAVNRLMEPDAFVEALGEILTATLSQREKEGE